jgi:hypothetical protein
MKPSDENQLAAFWENEHGKGHWAVSFQRLGWWKYEFKTYWY